MPVPREFLRAEKIRGIFKITNLKTDQLFLDKSDDIVKSYSDIRFKLDLGIHPSKELQKAYSELGLELFDIGMDVEAEKNENLDELLKKRKAWYLDQGARLYN